MGALAPTPRPELSSAGAESQVGSPGRLEQTVHSRKPDVVRAPSANRRSLCQSHGLELGPSSVGGHVASSNSADTLRLSVWVDEMGVQHSPHRLLWRLSR